MTLAPTQMYLVDGSNQITLTVGGYPGSLASNYSGVVVKDWDLGFPTSRDVVSDLAGQSGTLDLTQFHSSRTVKLDVSVLDTATQTRHQTMDTLRSMCLPGHRPLLYVWAQGWSGYRVMTLRGTPASCVVGQQHGAFLEASLAWLCPSGVMTALYPSQVIVAPQTTSTTGLSFTTGTSPTVTLSFPLSWAPGTLANTATLTNLGTESVPWVAQFYGGATGFTITNQTTGATFVCNTVVADGHFVQVDSGARTCLIDGNPLNSAFGGIDFTQSTWWLIPPGTSTLSVSATGSDASSTCYFNYSSWWV